MLAGQGTDATGTDMISSIQTRLSMQSRRSQDPRASIGSRGHSDRDGLMRAYDEEQAHGDFRFDDGHDGNMNGHGTKAYETIELESRK
jgi:magnesium transporter